MFTFQSFQMVLSDQMHLQNKFIYPVMANARDLKVSLHRSVKGVTLEKERQFSAQLN